MIDIKVGQLVRSAAGRDEGKYYLVYDVLDKAFVRVMDGEKKKLTNPKKKNMKHLAFFPEVAESIADKLNRGEKVTEEEVAEATKTLGLSHRDL
ncbi:MAG: KOW domain-containing RNA-binding protein [Thermincola sp.]|jgi:ribosomal protein L14E/L6E/L27E|nr:KOW domain-containing RNA-binding protein [Thermincola sp.]MDT3704835.1 KOW domain-containing RNA-binding protein [Thermincola sp.]